MSRLIHAGSAVVDYVYRIDTLPQPAGEKTASAYDRVAGGGFNMMVAARRTGMKVVFAGRHGTGPDGDFLRTAFAAEGIEILLPPTEGLDSGNSVVLITEDAERTFVSWPGAEGVMSADDLAKVTISDGDWIFTSGYTLSYPGSRDALSRWIAALPESIPLAFDPAPVVADIPEAVLARVLARTTWLSCNVTEAEVIAGGGNIQTNAELLMDKCLQAAGVVIRAGEAGAYLRLRDGEAAMVPGFHVDAVDTNGAGDTHIGAFLSALARGSSAREATRYANAAAAISVTRRGGSSAPVHSEIMTFLGERGNEGFPLETALS